MNIAIYQINMDRDIHHQKFRELDLATVEDTSIPIDSSIYDEVFRGDVFCQDLETVYRLFNTASHPLHRGHSLSVSDVVVTEEGAFFCQDIGFQEVSFDQSLTQKPDDLLRVVFVEPGKPAYESEIRNDYRAMQKAVGGLFDMVSLGGNELLVCNDEGKLLGMEGNRRLDNGTIIAGPFFIVGAKGGDCVSLSDKQAEKYLSRFSEPEQISQEEIAEDSYIQIISF